MKTVKTITINPNKPYIDIVKGSFTYIERSAALKKFSELKKLLSKHIKYHGKSVPENKIIFSDDVMYVGNRKPSNISLQAALKADKPPMLAHYHDELKVVVLFHALFTLNPSAKAILRYPPRGIHESGQDNENDRLIKFIAVHECFHYLRHHTGEWSREKAPENRVTEEYLVNRLSACAFLGDASFLKCKDIKGLQ